MFLPQVIPPQLTSKSLTAAGVILGNIHTNGSFPYVHTIWKCSFFLSRQAYLETSGILAVFSSSLCVKVFRHVAFSLYLSKKIKVVLWSSVKKPSRCWRFLDLVFSASSGREWSAVISALCWMNAEPSFTNTTKKPQFLPIFSKSFRLSKHDNFTQYVKYIQTVVNEGHKERWIFTLSLMGKSTRLYSLLVDREFHGQNSNLWTLLHILEEISL